MPVDDPNDLERVGQEIRINELKCEADELVGGKMASWESDNCPPGLAESFWQSVVDYENAPLTSGFQQLIDAGVELPAAETMTDQELTTKLWEVIHRLAEMRTFISSTDHLSNRELYTHLWEDSLREAHADMPYDEHSSYHIDILGSCSEEDMYLHMKHYANDEERARWHRDFPADEMPAHEDPPHDRDRHLPRS